MNAEELRWIASETASGSRTHTVAVELLAARAEIERLRYGAETARLIEEYKLDLYCDTHSKWCNEARYQGGGHDTLGEAVRAALGEKGEG